MQQLMLLLQMLNAGFVEIGMLGEYVLPKMLCVINVATRDIFQSVVNLHLHLL